MAEEIQGEYDVVVVGYGPAGITGAIYAARKKLKVLLIGDLPGGEVRNSGEIENWPGDGETDGNTLADKLISHLKLHTEDVEIMTDKVNNVRKNAGGGYLIETAGGKEFTGKTVVYTAGRRPRLLDVPGEEEFKNRGVSYCATCDAPLWPDKTVAVVGGGNTGAEAIIMFQKIAKKVYLLHIEDKLGADEILIRNFRDDPMVEIIYNAKTTKIEGEQMVTGLTYEDVKTGDSTDLKLDAVFVTIGALPNTDPIKELVELDKFNAIVTDRYGRTSLDGFLAAGDVTDIRDAQIVVAAGHGCSAALSAGDYLSRQAG